jgi:glutamine amidotransferase
MIYKKNKGKIGIIDYQAGNIQSIVNILKYCNQNVEIISTPKKIKKLNKLIFPGVGSFGFLSDFLRKKNFIEEINRFKDKGNLILGICLGMQIFCQNSQESSPNKYGLRWFNLKVKKFNNLNPHIGWSSIENTKKNFFLKDKESKDFYFLNNYYVPIHKKYTVCSSKYKNKFSSMIVKDNVIGVQFHPERSQKNGIDFFKKFVNL